MAGSRVGEAVSVSKTETVGVSVSVEVDAPSRVGVLLGVRDGSAKTVGVSVKVAVFVNVAEG